MHNFLVVLLLVNFVLFLAGAANDFRAGLGGIGIAAIVMAVANFFGLLLVIHAVTL